MAGKGQRFIDEGYTDPKPLLKVKDKYLIEYVIDSMRFPGAKFIFIVRKQHVDNFGVDSILKKIVPESEVLVIDEITQGAICTILKAKNFFNNDEEVITKDCDQVVDWVPEHFLSFVRRHNADGAVVSINTDNPGFSFVRVQENKILETAEKMVISNFGATGLYYFKRGSDLIKYANKMIDKNIRTNNEFYVCPVYNEYITDGKLILNYPVAEMIGLNTPSEFEKNKIYLQ
jgi:dTDP-glucose pyrophosphorylase